MTHATFTHKQPIHFDCKFKSWQMPINFYQIWLLAVIMNTITCLSVCESYSEILQMTELRQSNFKVTSTNLLLEVQCTNHVIITYPS